MQGLPRTSQGKNQESKKWEERGVFEQDMAAANPVTGENKPRIAIPEPSGNDPAYGERSLTPYLRAIEACGGEPVVIPLGLPPEELAKRISGCSAVLLPGDDADVDP